MGSVTDKAINSMSGGRTRSRIDLRNIDTHGSYSSRFCRKLRFPGIANMTIVDTTSVNKTTLKRLVNSSVCSQNVVGESLDINVLQYASRKSHVVELS